MYLNHDHVPHSCCSMCCPRGWGFTLRDNLLPFPHSRIKHMNIIGGTGQANTCVHAHAWRRKWKSHTEFSFLTLSRVSRPVIKAVAGYGHACNDHTYPSYS
eukprot:562545-Pelagomonas_calceolata.AAC.1